MELYFIRHAQSENNSIEYTEDYTRYRKTEPDITAKGRVQAERLASFLHDNRNPRYTAGLYDGYNVHGFSFTHLYTSPQLRAVRTASILSGKVGIPVRLWTDIHEYGGVARYNTGPGDYIGEPGWNRDRYRKEFPNVILPEDLGESGWWNSRPFETCDECSRRADRVYRELLDHHGGGTNRVVLVSHCMFYVFLVCRILGVPFSRERWFSLQNASLTRIDFLESGVVFQYQNRTEYLAPDMLT
jgi:broad specificity phosphatase PhoE